MKPEAPTKATAAAVSASKGNSRRLSTVTRTGGLARPSPKVTNVVPRSAKGSSFKAAQVASIERFNKMVAAKYPDLKSDIDLPQKFTCAVCWQIMVRPTHCIPCKHSFCEPCLRSISSAANGQFRSLCPYCRQSIHYTTPNKDLDEEIKNADYLTALEYDKRLKWFEKQEDIAKMPLPGFAPLRWASRVCSWSGPRTSKFFGFVERQLFNQFAFLALQLGEDHFSRTPPMLTTLFDLLLVLFFYFAFSPSVFASVKLLEVIGVHVYENKGVQAHEVTKVHGHEVTRVHKLSEKSVGMGECVFKTVDSGLLYLFPFPELEGLFGMLYWAFYATFMMRGFIRFVIQDWFKLLHEFGASRIWYLPFAVAFLWSQVFACEYLAKLMFFTTVAVPSAGSGAGFACVLLGLALLLHLPSVIRKRRVKVIIWAIVQGSFVFLYGFCTVKTWL